MDRLSLQIPNVRKSPPHPTVCCIYPSSVDKLKLINFPTSLLPALRIAIQTSWSKGIQSEDINYSKAYYEVKLCGYPWPIGPSNSSNVEVEVCRLITGIMRFMLSYGWGLEVLTPLQYSSDRDSWFFRKKTQETHVVMCSISFSLSDKIRVVDGSGEVTKTVRSTIENHWYRGLQDQRVYREAVEFKLKGRPWTHRQDKTHVAALLLSLIDALRSVDWVLYASVGHSMGVKEGGSQLDTWILKKSKP